MSDTTDDTEVTVGGYLVIPQETGNGSIKPPQPPEQIPEGEFKPE